MFPVRVRRPSGRTDLILGVITLLPMAVTWTSLPIAGLLRASETNYQALHDQYLALVLGPGLAQLWRARKDLRLAGMFFLIVMFLSPKRTTFTELPSFTQTADFLGPFGVRKGLLRALFLHTLVTRLFAAISVSIC